MNNLFVTKIRFLLVILILCGIASAFISPWNLIYQVSGKEKSSTEKSGIKPSAEQVNRQLGKMRVEFEENHGQYDKRVRYAARAAGSTIFLTADEAVYVMRIGETAKLDNSQCQDSTVEEKKNPRLALHDPQAKSYFALRMRIAGANLDSAFTGEEVSGHRTNYFKGSDKSGWQTDIPNFMRVRYENVYEGVAMVWHGRENGATQYDFVVEPNADATRITLEFDGADNLEIDVNGNLLIHTPAGIIKQAKPVSYQEADGVRQEIESNFIIEQSKIRFALGDYDRSKPLTIDPTVTLNNLAYSTLIGGGDDEEGDSIAVDSAGNTYLTGYANSTGFPTTSGAYDTSHNGGRDVFVTKLNAAGSALTYTTFIGGSANDQGLGIAVDSSGNVYLTGRTSNGTTDYPTTVAAYDTTHNGSEDVFVTKLNSTGSSLTYSTFIGGSGSDDGFGIAIDSSGNAYLTGNTADSTTDYPTTVGAYDTTHNGSEDVFVTKLNAAGSSLTYSTFIGGSGSDFGFGIAIDSDGNAYLTGSTIDSTTDYPTTTGSYDTAHNGISDVFVTKLNTTGSSLTYSTFMGGSDSETGSGIAVDSSGNAYITGNTSDSTTDFPTTASAYDRTHNGVDDVFVTKLNAAGSSLTYSTLIGGSGDDNGEGIAIDSSGNAYLIGYTDDDTTDYPTTTGAYDTTHNGGSFDVFMTKLNASGSALIYSTFIGGNGSDIGFGIAIDTAGNVYLTGDTVDSTTDYPTTNEAFQPFHAGDIDVFVSKFGDYYVAGKVVDPTGSPLSNVLIALSGQVSASVITGTDGTFAFLDTAPYQPHTVTATRSGYNINPPLFNISILNNNRELIFVGTPGSPTGGSGGTLRFTNLSVNKSENGMSLSLTVERVGLVLTTEPVTVDFTTANGTAVAGQDYSQTTGVLTFLWGENSKTITIPIVNDNALEPLENFSVVISNPTNHAEIQHGSDTTRINILDEDLANGNLLISEFRQRGRIGANDEYVKIFNPNDFPVTVNAPDDSAGLTLARTKSTKLIPVATIPNLVTIAARGHYLLTNNNPNGGFSLIDYPTGNGATTAVGDQTFSEDIPDNSNLVLLRTAKERNFTTQNTLDAIGFGTGVWAEGAGLKAIGAVNSETCFVRKFTPNGLQDTNNNHADFLLLDNHAQSFVGDEQLRIYSVLGAPAPESSESLPLMRSAQIGFEEYGTEIFNPTPVSNGTLGTLTMYRRITNNTNQPILRLRLRVIDFPTAGSASQRRFSSRPDFRLFSTTDEDTIKGVTLAAERLQPNGGGINSTLTVDSITQANPFLPNQSVIVAIRFGVMRYGRHPFSVAFEALQ